MTLNAGGMGRQDAETETLIPTTGGGFDVAHALRGEGFDASEDGTGRGTPLVPIAFSSKDYGDDALRDVSPTLRAMGHHESHANGGGQIAIAIQGAATRENASSGPDGIGVRTDGAAYTLEARQEVQAVAFDLVQATSPQNRSIPQNVSPTVAARSKISQISNMAVRRLTPLECERLQGFPDGHTAITFRGKAAADGPRYKALGNSMAINVMGWVLSRIHAHPSHPKGE